jgi:hypothetical protein
MKTVTALLLLIFFTSVSFGQIKYEKGYFINNDNKRIECLIKNREWKTNPTEFDYKIGKSGKAEIGNITSVKEFGIDNYYKFVGADVKIDRSFNPKTSITTEKDPIWKQEKLFLKVLVEGKANLYVFEGENIVKYFYSMNGGNTIDQLVYKEYKVDMNLVKNTTFRQQIWKDLQFKDTFKDEVQNMPYTAEALGKYFTAYDSSFGNTVTQIKPIERKSYLNLKLTPGVNFSSGSMSIPVGVGKPLKPVTFKSNQTFRLGLDAEWVFAYNKYKWALVFEPTYQSFKSGPDPKDGTIDYSSIEFPLGVRYYYHLNDQTRLYLNGFYIPGFGMNFNSTVKYIPDTNVQKSFDVKSSGNIAVGGGVDYKKFSMEARYYTNRTLSDEPYLDPVYNRFSIILGYRLFTTKH